MAKREDGGSGTTVEAPGGPGIPPTQTRRDPANPTRLGGDPSAPQPFVHPGISDPAALRYAAGAAERRRPAAIPRYNEPVAGGPDVSVPRLDGEAIGGLTMAQQAAPRPLPQPSFDAGLVPAEPALGRPAGLPAPAGIVAGTEHLAAPAAPTRQGGLVMPGGLSAGDMLPATARQDSNFRQGQGDMVAMNQPELAKKYGVMRGGQYIAPQQLASSLAPGQRQVGGAKTQQNQPQVSQQTLEGLAAVQKFNEERGRAEGGGEDKLINEEAQRGVAGQAAGVTQPKMSDEAKRNLLDDMDEFDITRLRNAIYKDLLNNDDQKKIIEARLSPLDLSDLVISGRVTQTVPIIPGKFEPEFQSYGGDEDLIIKRLLGEEMENLKPMNAGMERYITDRYTIMGLTVSMKAVNKHQLPAIYDKDGLWDNELFWKKYKIVAKFNFHMIGSLVVNWFWFDLRVRHLFKAEALGNG